MNEHENALCHFGVKGMRWGVRRYQNEDGTRTPAGKRHERELDDDEEPKARSGTAGKVAVGVAVGASAGVAAILASYAIKDPRTREAITKMANKSLDGLKNLSNDAHIQKAKDFVKKAGSKTLKSLGERVTKTGNAMADAAMMSMGGIAISKLAKKLETTDEDSEEVKNRNKIILDTTTAGINALTKANSSNNSNKNGNNKGGNLGKDVTDALGAPSKKTIDKSGSAYQSLFKDSSGNQRDADTRATIKSLANAGYDVDQITEYLRQVDNGTLKHSYEDVRDELNVLCGIRYVDYLMS